MENSQHSFCANCEGLRTAVREDVKCLLREFAAEMRAYLSNFHLQHQLSLLSQAAEARMSDPMNSFNGYHPQQKTQANHTAAGISSFAPEQNHRNENQVSRYSPVEPSPQSVTDDQRNSPLLTEPNDSIPVLINSDDGHFDGSMLENSGCFDSTGISVKIEQHNDSDEQSPMFENFQDDEENSTGEQQQQISATTSAIVPSQEMPHYRFEMFQTHKLDAEDFNRSINFSRIHYVSPDMIETAIEEVWRRATWEKHRRPLESVTFANTLFRHIYGTDDLCSKLGVKFDMRKYEEVKTLTAKYFQWPKSEANKQWQETSARIYKSLTSLRRRGGRKSQ